MLMQTNRPLVLLVAALVVISGVAGVRRANAQAEGVDKAVERKYAEEKAAAADQRNAEVQKLRAEQERLKLELDLLDLEKQKLQLELERRKAQAEQDAALVKRAANRRDLEVQHEEAVVAELAAKIAARNEDALLERDRAVKNEQQARREWVVKRNGDQTDLPVRAQLDLVSLANNYVDAMGSLQLAELELSQLADVAGPEHKKMQTEGAMLKIKVQTAKRKVAIFRGMAEAAREAAKADLEIAAQQFKNGLGPRSALAEAESRLRMIEVILAH